MTFSFLGVQKLQFGFQLWECNVIFIMQYVSSQVVQDIQHLTVSVDVFPPAIAHFRSVFFAVPYLTIWSRTTYTFFRFVAPFP